MPRILNVGAVIIHASDPARLAAWYSDCFGIPMQSSPSDGSFYGEIGDPVNGVALQFGILRATAAAAPATRPVMVNYRVDDLDAMLTTLEGHGVAIERRADNEYGRFAHISDAEGNPIEI